MRDGRNRTHWFCMKFDVPVHRGWYEWKGPMVDGVQLLRWCGRAVHYPTKFGEVEMATDWRDCWRGLAEKPE